MKIIHLRWCVLSKLIRRFIDIYKKNTRVKTDGTTKIKIFGHL